MRYVFALLLMPFLACASVFKVGQNQPYKTIQSAVEAASTKDTILVMAGKYNVRNFVLRKQLTFIGKNYPVITGQGEKIMEIHADSTSFYGLKFVDVATSYINDNAALKFVRTMGGLVQDCKFDTCFFAIYTANSNFITINNNNVQSRYTDEASSGNAIHAWYSNDLTITNNKVYGHRDGIYLEFVENSVITNNYSYNNLRYGLHFMFSHNNVYSKNIFEANGAGCAVMYSNNVAMLDNIFRENWGAASYGLLLKDIKDSRLEGNYFYHNSVAIHTDNSMRLLIKSNTFELNGWGLRIMGSCMDNNLTQNNFIDNTFQVATNSQRNYNTYEGNYWSDYTGYDLDRDGRGDVPHRPVSLYTYMVTQNAPTVILMRSLIIDLLNLAEKVMPTITPKTLTDDAPLMKPYHARD